MPNESNLRGGGTLTLRVGGDADYIGLPAQMITDAKRTDGKPGDVAWKPRRGGWLSSATWFLIGALALALTWLVATGKVMPGWYGATSVSDEAKAAWYVARARAQSGVEKLTDATMVERLQADLDRLCAPVEEAPAPVTGLPDRTPHQLTETVRALEDRTDTMAGWVRDLTRRLKALEARPRVSPKRKARATKGGAPGGAA